MCNVCQESVGRGAMAGSIAGDIEESQGEESEGAGAAAGAEVGTEAEAEAAVDDDYNRSRRLIRQIDIERRLQVMQEAEEVGIFEDILAEWVGRYVVCKIDGTAEVSVNEVNTCPHKGTEGWEHIQQGAGLVQEEVSDKKRFAKFAAYFRCRLPQEICNS
ncbi:uncharacterized protein B0J16DRAFT_48627 [Fusarium flagelliforme]|uniref:uncharacterized protein n=1 Tax=Fusarium flagelliforme TaxID=2675880 RepID=UPI001E8D3DBB|nr:uncharacterized protein B0J16DRAFT_48627 [Fusarium flagelliforme]KAH7199129.1 hypothetical protein B0J16DRAFT_48627 [Fusarium flagelliforme]